MFLSNNVKEVTINLIKGLEGESITTDQKDSSKLSKITNIIDNYRQLSFFRRILRSFSTINKIIAIITNN